MNVPRFVLPLFLGLLLVLPAWPAACADAPASADQKPAAKPADVSDPTQDVWTTLLQNRVEELGAIDAETVALTKRLPDASRRLNASLSGIEDEYQRLMTLSRVSRGLPLELSVVQQRLMRLNERLSEVLGPLEGTLNTLKSRLSEISLLEQDSTPTQGETDVSPELKAFLDDLVQTQSRLNTVQVRISRVLGPARKLQENISALCERVSKSIPGLWQDYYLQRSGKIYDMDSWLNIHKSLNALQETFAVRMNAELPWTVAGWIGVILRALVLIIPLHGLIFVSRRLSRTWPESMRTGWNRMCGHSFVWLSFGFMFHFAAWSPSGSYHVLSIVGTLLLSLGQMALAWDLYTFERNDLPLRSPLWPLFAPLLGGLLLLFFNLPGPILGGIWLIMLLVTLWRDYKRAMPDIPFPLVINLLKGQAVILWIAVLMTLIGWGRLSILVCVAYAAVAVCVQQAVGFMRIMNTIAEHMPQEGVKALFSGFLLALALPAMLVLATAATGLWILAYPGGEFLLTHLANMDVSVGKTSFNMLQVLFIVSAFYVTRSFISVGRSFIADLPAHGMRLDRSLVGPIQAGFTYLLWGLFGLYTLSALGFSLTSIAVVAGGLSVGIGFGLQNIINNFVSGLLVIFGQTLREGDVIDVGGVNGVVRRINIRSTQVETFDNAVIFVPNAEFLSGKLTNWTRNGRMVRQEVAVGVAYGSDIQLTETLLKQIAKDHPKVLTYPEPAVMFNDFAASSLDFRLRFWVGDILHGSGIASDIRKAIDARFTEAGIEIAVPQMDVHLRQNETVPVELHTPRKAPRPTPQEDKNDASERNPTERATA